MKSIEEIKIELTLKMLSGTLDSYEDIKDLPIDDELRTFVCSLGSIYAYLYASEIDKSPRDDTREAACKDPEYAYLYASEIDESPRDNTREAAYKDPIYKQWYIENLGE
jgi:hypothetical protein